MTSLTICADCGIDAWWFKEDGQVVHEDFYVHDELWDRVCPDDSHADPGGLVLCIGCFEQRLGRPLLRGDFKGAPNYLFGTPPSERFIHRWIKSADDCFAAPVEHCPTCTCFDH